MDNLYWVTTVAISTGDITLQLPNLFTNSFTVENTPPSSPGSGQTKPYGICFGASCWLNRLETLLRGYMTRCPNHLNCLPPACQRSSADRLAIPQKKLILTLLKVWKRVWALLVDCLIRLKCFLLHSGKSIPTIVSMNEDGWNQSINQSQNCTELKRWYQSNGTMVYFICNLKTIPASSF